MQQDSNRRFHLSTHNTTEPGQIYPSNKDTYVNYTDVNGDPAEKVAYESWAPGDFTIPAVSDGYERAVNGRYPACYLFEQALYLA